MMSASTLRPIDLARPYGLSSQAIRNYEDQGILPPAVRSTSGHRRYDERHRRALAAFVALVAGHGHATSAELLRLTQRGALDELYALLDRQHAQLVRDRDTLDLVGRAVGDLTATSGGGAVTPGGGTVTPDLGTATPDGGRAPSDDRSADPGRSPIPIGALAHRLRVRPATLRAWEAAGVLRPARDPATGYRAYGPADVRDAHLAHQLRRGGYLLAQIAEVVSELREHGSQERLREALADWQAAVRGRGLAMLRGAAALAAVLDEPPQR